MTQGREGTITTIDCEIHILPSSISFDIYIPMNTHKKATHFLKEEHAYRLGMLQTESSHPKTVTLGETANHNIPAAVKMLFDVDSDIQPVAEDIFASKTLSLLVTAMQKTISNGNKIFFTGCGATGRLSILLESIWHRFWKGFLPNSDISEKQARKYSEQVISVMAGGDYALIKSVEGFEDFADFGKLQLEQAGVKEGDLVIAITEGGETPFVIGTAWQGVDTGATVFFVYNNPTELLKEHVKRSRDIINEPRVHKIDLSTGPMAVRGSTRMQATTIELLVAGGALEIALNKIISVTEPLPLEYANNFTTMLNDLSNDDSVKKISEIAALEAELYSNNGLVNYFADEFLLDILTDTTERSPTFMLPPFRPHDDKDSPQSWAFTKNPLLPTVAAWSDMLGRTPRGINWNSADYKKLNAPQELSNNPPKLNNNKIHKFLIGNEPDQTRCNSEKYLLSAILAGKEVDKLTKEHPFAHAFADAAKEHKDAIVIYAGEKAPTNYEKKIFHIKCHLPDSPLNLWSHLALKLILNTLSTVTMAATGRIEGNCMAWVSPSNKKLIDRGTRLISELANVDYETACHELFIALDKVKDDEIKGIEPVSPVSRAVEKLTKGGTGATPSVCAQTTTHKQYHQSKQT